jgi:dihydroorotate dehydrogenase
MGFGWVETGTVTPKPQPGNPRKRLFRLVEQRAIINRMGFNSAGLVVYRRNLARVRGPIPVGANIGKNRLTPIEAALDDYLVGMRAVYARADYIAINISSPNTQNLRELQETDNLDAFLQALKAEQASLTTTHARYVPLALKIAPDLSEEQIGEIARLLLKYQFDAVIATNTTTSRPQLDDVPLASETGGLSGEPLRALSTRVISRLYASLQGQVTIIGVGGISSAQDAWEKLLAGADALQLYSAFIYQGPAVIRDIVSGLALKTRELGCDSLQEAVRKARASNPVP